MSGLLRPKLSAFTTTIGEKGKEISGPLAPTGITGYMADTTKEVGEYLSAHNGANLDDALAVTGITTELIQEHYANMAAGGPAEYVKYLEAKQGILNGIRQEILRTYASAMQRYLAIGYPRTEAEKMAKEIAKEAKASQMKIFHTLFPHSGQKVKHVY